MLTISWRRRSSQFATKVLAFVYLSFIFALSAPPAKAASITVPIEVNDQDIFADLTAAYVGGLHGRVGSGYVGKAASVYVLPFKLPTLPAGERITAATLSVNVENWSNWGGLLRNVDMYGIGVTSDSSVATYPEYFVDGVNPSTNSDAYLLQNNWITPTDIPGDSGSGKTIPKISQDFAWFIQALYDNGAQPGEYGFLSLAHDATMTTQRFYALTSANSTTFPKPVITIVTATVGTSYYLNGDTGSDSGAGSAISPWKTLNRAQLQLQPGDTLYCTGQLGIVKMYTATGPAGERPYKVGTAEKLISYKAWTGKNQPCITQLAFDGVQKDAYLSFEGFLFDRGEVDTPGSLENSAIYLAGAWHITFTDCDVVGAQPRIPAGVIDPAVSFAPYTPDSLAVIASGNPGNASYVTVQNCRIKNGGCGIHIYENDAYPAKQSRYWQILENEISNTPEDGMQIGGGDAGAGSVVRGNYIHGQDLYTATLITYGFAYDANGLNPAAFSGKQWARVVQDVTGATGIYYYSAQANPNGWSRFYVFADDKTNIPAYMRPYGWKLASDPTIQFKALDKDGVTPATSDCCHTDGLAIMGKMTGALFEKNRINASLNSGGAAGGGLKIQNIPNRNGISQPPTDITFQNNLIYTVTPSPSSGFLLLLAGGKNVKFLHNTVFGGPGVRFNDVFNTGFQGVYFYNNILPGGGVSNTNGVNLATSDCNVWAQAPTGGITAGPHDKILPTKLTFPQQVAAMGFVNYGAEDLRINAGSPAQNIGLLNSASFPMPLDDFNGFLRGSTTTDLPDAGAFEVGSPTP